MARPGFSGSGHRPNTAIVTYDNTTDQTYYFASTDLGAGEDTLTHRLSRRPWR